MNSNCIVFIGPPGAGKGTQARKLSLKLSIPSISTGDLLRESVEKGTNLGIEAKDYIEKGNLIPDNLIVGIISDYLKELPNIERGIIFDGFPRTVRQALELDVILKEYDIGLKKVFNIFGSNEELLKRIVIRSKQLNRSDDNAEVMKHRLEIYNRETIPILEFYKKRNLLKLIDGLGDIEEIHKKLVEELN